MLCTGLPDRLLLLAHVQQSAAEGLPGLAAGSCHLLVPLPECKVLEKFIRNLLFVNDLVDQEIHLASGYKNRVQFKEQRAALFPVMEDFRSRVKGTTKASLRLWRPV